MCREIETSQYSYLIHGRWETYNSVRLFTHHATSNTANVKLKIEYFDDKKTFYENINKICLMFTYEFQIKKNLYNCFFCL